MKNRSDLTDNQNKALDFLLNKKKCGLFLDMAGGKTVISLTAISDMLDRFLINKVLIIGTKKVAENVWLQETQQWDHLKHLKVNICLGNQKQRITSLQNDADIYVINRENVPWLINESKIKWKWGAVIIDESTSFKSTKASRFKALKKVTKYLKTLILLTGTPIPKGYIDIWSQVYLIDNGQRLGRTITEYRNRYFKSDYMGFNYELLPNSQDKINDLLKDICITMPLDEARKIPVIYLNRYINLPDKVVDQYKYLEKEFMLSLDKVNISTLSAAALSSKLLQMCNGAIYDEEKNWHLIHDEKIETLKEIVEENPNENLLVSYNFKSDLERLQKEFPKAKVLKTSQDEKDWNEGKIKMLLVHPASCGHGLNLQFGGSILIWFGLNWSLELYQQLNKRLPRTGQKNVVRIVHIIAKGCLDEKLTKAVELKAKTQQELINYLKYSI